MASINATTSSGIVATADNTGTLQLQSAGTTIATVSSTGLAVTGTVSSTGNITTPNRTAFIAYLTGNVTPSSGAFIVWNATQLNVGNNFSTATGKFTAPVAGLYWFNFILSSPSSQTASMYFYLDINGTRTRDFIEGVTMTTNTEIHSSTIWYLNAGDVAGIVSGYGGWVVEGANANFNSEFQGYLIG